MFMVLIISRTCPGRHDNILTPKALSSKNEWLLFSADDLVIFPHFKVS